MWGRDGYARLMAEHFGRILNKTAAGPRLADRSGRFLGAAIMAVSVGIVAMLVASVALGPMGDQVLARDGWSNRDVYDAAPAAAPAQRLAFFEPTDRPRRQAEREGERWSWRRRETGTHVASMNSLGRHSVCVRLCDGFFFPLGEVRQPGDLDTQAAVCGGACPGAPTRLYVTSTGTSEIETAVSVPDGHPYTALPVAFAHTSAVGPTCTCHAESGAEPAMMTPTRDITLRDGDSVMTTVGWRVFKGTRHWPYTRDDFTSVAAANHLSSKVRVELTALEKASIDRRIASLAPAVPPLTIPVPAASGSGLKGTDGRLSRAIDGGTPLYR